MKLHKVALGAVAAFALAATATTAVAGDRAGLKDDRPFSWSGFYVGAQMGYGWGSSDTTHLTDDFFGSAAGQVTALDNNGLLGGAHAGYNLQFGSVVVGVEVGYSFASIRDNCTECLTAGFDDRFHSDVNDLFTVTGRVGYATPSSLLYVKGGWANSEIEYRVSTRGGTAAGFKDRVNGWTVGGGYEFKVAKGLSFGIEYMYVKLDDDTHTASGTTTFPAASDIDIHTVTARLSYQLGK
jgi:outer membrane immunogenic protein